MTDETDRVRDGPDPRSVPIGIDANVLDKADRREALTEEFLTLALAGRITVSVGRGVEAEAARAEHVGALGTLARLSATPPVRPTRSISPAQHLSRIRVRAIVCGNAAPGRHDADAAHLSEAAEAGCGYFVTYDGRILRKRDDLQAFAIPGLRIVTLEELLEIIRHFEQGSGHPPGPSEGMGR